MPTKYNVVVGRNAVRTGTFFWNVTEDSTRRLIIARKGFTTSKAAIADLEAFRRGMAAIADLEAFQLDIRKPYLEMFGQRMR